MSNGQQRLAKLLSTATGMYLSAACVHSLCLTRLENALQAANWRGCACDPAFNSQFRYFDIRSCRRLQQAVARASKKIQQGSDKMALASSLKMVSAGVEMVFGSAAAISAAFGYTDRVGLDVELLEQTQQSILQLFSAEE